AVRCQPPQREWRRWKASKSSSPPRPGGAGFVSPGEEVIQDQFVSPLGRPQQAVDTHVDKARYQFRQREGQPACLLRRPQPGGGRGPLLGTAAEGCQPWRQRALRASRRVKEGLQALAFLAVALAQLALEPGVSPELPREAVPDSAQDTVPRP